MKIEIVVIQEDSFLTMTHIHILTRNRDIHHLSFHKTDKDSKPEIGTLLVELIESGCDC